MSVLPRVTTVTRERVAREFDDRGPDVCRREIILELEANNPELLDMASRCARDVGNFDRTMTGFCFFYRLLTAEARVSLHSAAEGPGAVQFSLLPHVTTAIRAAIVGRIDALGSQEFTRVTLSEWERDNPELLLMAHNFAVDQLDYLGVMQGFALLFASLSAETAQEPGVRH